MPDNIEENNEIDPKLLELGESGFPVAFEQAMALIMGELSSIVEPECLVTILIRTPEKPENDICWTSDDLGYVRDMIYRCAARENLKKNADD